MAGKEQQDYVDGALNDIHPSLLITIVDCNPIAWQLRRKNTPTPSSSSSPFLVPFNDFLRTFIIFLNAYVLMHRRNQLVVISSQQRGSNVIYPRRIGPTSSSKDESTNSSGLANADDSFVPVMHTLPSIIASKLIDAVSDSTFTSAPSLPSSSTSSAGATQLKTSSLSQALSTALCIINRQQQKQPKLQPRIVIIQVSKDDSSSYNAMMNSIFSAQKLNVPVDSIVLSKGESHFLQQASLLTKGVYLHSLDQRDVLTQMLTHCLPSSHTRTVLEPRVQQSVDFKASCFCHRKPVETAFMCSVCLALTCDEAEACGTCGTVVRKS